VDQPKRYVWEVWVDVLFDVPHVRRLTLVKLNPAGGCTALVRGRPRVVRPMQGKQFFTDPAKLEAWLRAWYERKRNRLRGEADSLDAALAKPGLPGAVEVVPDAATPQPPAGWLDDEPE
jgi:hypothetical protein